jgi:hypothetical protein
MRYPELLKFRVLRFGNSKDRLLLMCDDLKKNGIAHVEYPSSGTRVVS